VAFTGPEKKWGRRDLSKFLRVGSRYVIKFELVFGFIVSQ